MKNVLLLIFVLLSLIGMSQITEREQQVLDEINLCRTNPQQYLQYIDSFLEYNNSDAGEKATARELKKVLKKMKPLEPLVFSPELYEACKIHGDYIIKVKKLVHSDCVCAENVQYGHSDVRFAVIDLLIDNGISSRGHRKNILNPEFGYFAVYEIPQKVKKMDYIFIQQFDWKKK
ncbi:MAG TPA: CAP domain-containing protein [Bacteroidales bacterium]|nr:CAP domain-containing protein [Bacteroidales bacterium]